MGIFSYNHALIAAISTHFAMCGFCEQLRSISGLSEALANARTGTVYEITGIVTYREKVKHGWFVIQDGDNALSVYNDSPTHPLQLQHGDLVQASGMIDLDGNGHPRINCNRLDIVKHGTPISAKRITPEELPSFPNSNMLISISGIIIDAFKDDIDAEWSFFTLDSGGFTLCLVTRAPEIQDSRITSYIGARVEVTGICRPTAGQRQLISNPIHIDSIDQIRIIIPPPDPFAAANAEFLGFMGPNPGPSIGRRSATGTVIATWDCDKLLLKTDDNHIIRAELSERQLPHYRDRIRVVGFPETDLYNVILTHALWCKSPGKPSEEPPAVQLSARNLIADYSGRKRYNFDFHGKTIKLRGTVRGLPTDDVSVGNLYLNCDGQMVTVSSGSVSNAFDQIGLGDIIEVTGTCIMETEKMGLNHTIPRINGYKVVVRTPLDISIIARPSWWTTTKLLVVMGMMGFTLIAILIWNASLKALAIRKGRELFRSQIEKAEAALRIDERTRLAAELHDYIAQNLTAVSYQIAAAESALSINSGEIGRFLGSADRILHSCQTELRRCLWDLRNDVLSDPDLANAIGKTISSILCGTSASILFNVNRSLLNDTTTQAILSITRELVANAVRHGHAKNISIEGEIKDRTLHFLVEDDGVGFDPESCPSMDDGHFGLNGIAERVKRLKGEFSISSTIGSGTQASVTLHLAASPSAQLRT